MNAPGSSTPISLVVSKTPEQAPPSLKTSPPPLKQYRLHRHHAAPRAAAMACNDELNNSSLISILHGHDVTPRDFSIASNLSSFLLPDVETRDGFEDDERNDEIADFEVAMYSSNPNQNHAHAEAEVDSRPDVESTRPLFPKNEEFDASPEYRERFTLTPKMKLFGAKY